MQRDESGPSEIDAPWAEVRTRINPFDLILFHGSDAVSDVICLLESEELKDGEFSHCGIAVPSELLPGVPQLLPGKIYVCESTCSLDFGGVLGKQVPDAVSGKGVMGVQIRDLDELVPSYLGAPGSGAAVAWCPLLSNPWSVEADRPRLSRLALGMAEQYGGTPYDADPVDLLSTLFPCMRPVRYAFDEVEASGQRVLVSTGLQKRTSKRPWLFCSDLVATVYQRLGIIGSDVDPRDIVPVDFLGRGESRLPCLVSEIIRIEREADHP